jgi:hypothetical protein
MKVSDYCASLGIIVQVLAIGLFLIGHDEDARKVASFALLPWMFAYLLKGRL